MALALESPSLSLRKYIDVAGIEDTETPTTSSVYQLYNVNYLIGVSLFEEVATLTHLSD